MRNCIESGSRSRMSGYEYEASFLRARRGPLEIVLRLDGLIVLVNTDQRHVDVEAREVEVVRVAAEKCGLKLWNKNEANVGVLLVTIKIVLTTLVERDHVRPHSSRFQRFRFDRGALRASGCEGFGVSRACLHCSIHARGHVLDAHQHV